MSLEIIDVGLEIKLAKLRLLEIYLRYWNKDKQEVQRKVYYFNEAIDLLWKAIHKLYQVSRNIKARRNKAEELLEEISRLYWEAKRDSKRKNHPKIPLVEQVIQELNEVISVNQHNLSYVDLQIRRGNRKDIRFHNERTELKLALSKINITIKETNDQIKNLEKEIKLHKNE